MNTQEQWAIGIDSDDERVQIITQDGQHLCYVEQDPVTEYANLIVAAPKMHKALLAVYSDIDLTKVEGGSDELNILVQQALEEAYPTIAS